MRYFALLLLLVVLPAQAQDFWQPPSTLEGFSVEDFAVGSDGTHWAISGSDLYQSIDTMRTWLKVEEVSLPQSIVVPGSVPIVGTFHNGIWSREDGTWQQAIAPSLYANTVEFELVSTEEGIWPTVFFGGSAGTLFRIRLGSSFSDIISQEVMNVDQLILSDDGIDEIHAFGDTIIYQHWGFINRSLSNASGEWQEIPNFAASFSDEERFYYTESLGHAFFVSEDGGQTSTQFATIPGWVPIQAFVVSGETILASTRGGLVLVSINGGAGWADASSGLSDTPDEFYLAPDGYVYAIESNDISRSTEPLVQASGVAIERQLPVSAGLEVYPNPSSGESQILLTVPDTRTVEIEVFDALGRRVTSLGSQTLSPGKHSFSIPDLASGVYFVRSGGSTKTLIVQ